MPILTKERCKKCGGNLYTFIDNFTNEHLMKCLECSKEYFMDGSETVIEASEDTLQADERHINTMDGCEKVELILGRKVSCFDCPFLDDCYYSMSTQRQNEINKQYGLKTVGRQRKK